MSTVIYCLLGSGLPLLHVRCPLVSDNFLNYFCREVLLSPGDAIFQSGIPSVGWWKLWGKVVTTHGRKGSPSHTAWSETYDAQHA